jgi:hypothetical protein
MNWKPINSHPHYEVSDSGLIRRIGADDLIGQWKNWGGYQRVKLSGPRKEFFVHRLVAEAFIHNPDALPVVNHKDSVRHNNDVQNLEWCTQAQNLEHCRNSGRAENQFWKGKRSPNASLSDETVAEIRAAYGRGGKSWGQLSKEFCISKRTIGKIIKGESYV